MMFRLTAKLLNRVARIFKPTRSTTQVAWGNTNEWRVTLDNQERWENPNIGWASSGDPLSSISTAMCFATKEDAINFCVKNEWDYEIEEPHERQIHPKQYASNFSWNKRTRVETK